jgi:hypothetical protein
LIKFRQQAKDIFKATATFMKLSQASVALVAGSGSHKSDGLTFTISF